MGCLVPAATQAQSTVGPYFMVIVDNSGSMTSSTGSGRNSCGQPHTRMSDAKCVLQDVVNGYGEATFGLERYRRSCGGSCNSTSCSDTCGCSCSETCNWTEASGEVLVPIAEGNQADVLEWVDYTCSSCSSLTPGNEPELHANQNTPIAGSLRAARAYYAGSDPRFPSPIATDPFAGCRPYYVILLTDGEETCSGSPTNAATELRSTTVGGTTYDIRTFVIGFGITAGDPDTEAIADRGGTDAPGTHKAFYASDETSLALAFSQIMADAILYETCNGADDDCDTRIDEGYTLYCDRPSGVNPPPTLCTDPGERLCDGADDNCNGAVDEGLTNACGTCGPTPAEVCNVVDDDCDGVIDEGVCGGCVPSAEICDNLDNDCDGLIDDGVTRACGTDVGECTTGIETCSAGDWGECTGIGPSTEVCDGRDNDCDGATDGISRPCGSDVGECRPGAEICAAGVWGMCSGGVGPSPEICDARDNDCDGTVDDGNPGGSGSCGSDIGVCVRGSLNCIGGSIVCTGGVSPSPETCNGDDDDCDGSVDEGVPTMGSCGSSVGACSMGVLTCTGGTFTCQGGVGPSTETCNGIDDDCDGTADEGNPGGGASCGTNTGACSTGTLTCASGALTCVGATGPTPETCNDADDDCDGSTDEGNPEGGASCGSSTGECRAGTMTCTAGTLVCTGGVGPSTETCNASDDDCDSRIDEGNPGGGASCGTDTGECTLGTLTCSGGMLSCIGGTGPTEESCDGLDNDCDGPADEGNPGGGAACGSSIGTCMPGTLACTGGTLTCTGGTGPATEACDSLDNDCDGLIDEGNPGGGAACGTDTGECAPGAMACTGGSLTCIGGRGPATEVCDGLDNDCDASTDEGNPGGGGSCGSSIGACMPGTLTCTGGGLACTGGVAPTSESCNATDDDCDGNVDESVPTMGACGESEGECEPGVSTCVAGSFTCVGARGPVTDVCDGRDNDCDASIDEGNPGGGAACGTETGECDEGTTQCLGGSLTCVGGVSPIPESCDSLDDDCDGLIDEGNPGGGGSCGTTDVGLCEFGALACMDGGIVCVGETGPAPERCDGLDNDCDSSIDEGDPEAGTACGDDTGECTPGVTECTAGELVCQGAVGPTEEICDGLDNDCDGVVDDGLSVGAPCGSDTGECSPGRLLCMDGALVCTGAIDPVDEECDALDNDCDGNVDESLALGGACGEDEGECMPGMEQCVRGMLVCTGGVSPQREVCDCLDNDCDGAIDEEEGGAGLCPGESACVDCQCALQCMTSEFGFTCPSGRAPVVQDDGTCYCEAELCNATDCAGQTVERDGTTLCEPGSDDVTTCVCRNNECTFACDGVVCDEGTVCDPRDARGVCVEDSCRVLGCPDGQVCNVSTGDCESDPCEAAGCSAEQACRAGVCETSCGGVTCDDGEVCHAGSCETDPCADASCASGEVCDPASGECVSNECAGVSCPPGTVCDATSGDCDADPCNALRCPDGEHCDEGECARDVTPSEDAGSTTFDAGTHQPDAATTPDTEDRVLAAGGCLCRASGPSGTSGGPIFAMLVLLGLFVRRARRRSRGDCRETLAQGAPPPARGRGQGGGLREEVAIQSHLSTRPPPQPSPASGGGSPEQRQYDGPRAGEGARAGTQRVLLAAVAIALALLASGCEVDPFCLSCGDEPDAGDAGRSMDAAVHDADVPRDTGVADSGPAPDACAPVDETCNELDDDCDTNVDEDFDLTTSLEHCGACDTPCAPPHAFAVCADSTCGIDSCDVGWNDLDGDPSNGCEYRCLASESDDSICDLRDNDCDGTVDEDVLFDTDPENCGSCGRNCRFAHASAGCSAGTCVIASCDPGFYDLDGALDDGCEHACTPDSPPVEVCDSRDNDCNGMVDEGDPGSGAACGTDEGECTSGVEHCVSGAITCVGSVAPTTELCNGLDDDCDGSADEGDPEGGRLCGIDTGACARGREQCIGGALVCTGEVGPTAEVCNGLDDDCNGLIDDGDPGGGASCGDDTGECTAGAQHCRGGVIVCEGAVGPVAEVCDGLDNNCDGNVDEGNPGGGGSCGTDVGSCSPGTRTCTGGVLVCTGSTGGSPELCNGLDDDCDGTIDNGNPEGGASCGLTTGECTGGTQVCLAGTLQCQGGTGPTAEICDGLDNDCDGTVDDGNPGGGSACGTSVGECSSGTSTCSGGTITCVGAVGPSTEICDGLDNDCDGSIDEGNPGGGASCGTDTGACTAGTQTCIAGRLQCTGGTGPSPERCNGVDDDCDGVVDQGNPEGGSSCGSSVGACSPGTITCSGGTLTCSGGAGPTSETCNGLDDDCDGSADEGNPGGGAACGSSTGACTAGAIACVGGALVCTGGTGPSTETCNGVDDDCDGNVDEGNPGGGASCGIDTGACSAGTIVCASGALVCAGGVGPATETCNGIDDDCDGVIDQGNPGGGGLCGTDVGQCSAGTRVCSGGTLVCSGATGPGTESCNALDDDCDGNIDEGNPGGGAACGSSTGACSQGTQTCVGGTVQCVGGTGPSVESCNGADDDCDGTADEDYDFDNDPTNCGSCGRTCSFAHAAAGCMGGSCAILGCNAGFVDADGDPTNGCEYSCSVAGAEVCNGRDDDCDMNVDEALSPPSSFCNPNGVCAGTSATCAGSSGWVCNYPATHENPETSCDSLDNDCDGAIDEPFALVGTSCSNGIGECRRFGAYECNAAGNGVQCNAPAAGAPSAETCNGRDDDCDASLDEGPGGTWVPITGSFGTHYMFAYEASRPDATSTTPGTSSARVCSMPDRMPWTNLTHAQAEAACSTIGARLCTEEEWETGCNSASGSCDWSYASSCGNYQSMTCNGNDYDTGSAAGDQDDILATESLASCYSPWNGRRIYDMSGNAEEWAAARSAGVNPLRGGSSNDTAGGMKCGYDFAVAGDTQQFPSVGFRCCRSTPVSDCSDGAQDYDETDVDCGGGACGACGTGQGCAIAADCASNVCTGGVCQAVSCSDGVLNGSESDVDCGGSCGDCANGRTCGADSDCTSGSCIGTCRPSCSVFDTDSFGYVGCESTPATSPCDDIRTTGTSVLLGDDGTVTVPLGFDIDFYGTTYSSLTISSNGIVTFDGSDPGWTNDCLTTDEADQLIAAFWDDLDPTDGGVWYQTIGTAPNRRFVVQWVAEHRTSTSSTADLRLVLYENGSHITACYPDTNFSSSTYNSGRSATAGIQDIDTDDLEYSCNTSNSLPSGLVLDYIHP